MSEKQNDLKYLERVFHEYLDNARRQDKLAELIEADVMDEFPGGEHMIKQYRAMTDYGIALRSRLLSMMGA